MARGTTHISGIAAMSVEMWEVTLSIRVLGRNAKKSHQPMVRQEGASWSDDSGVLLEVSSAAVSSAGARDAAAERAPRRARRPHAAMSSPKATKPHDHHVRCWSRLRNGSMRNGYAS